ncbi:hypothetical protein D3C78_1098300 [compost metagenome]
MGAHGLGEPVDKAGARQAVGHHHQRRQVNQRVPGAGILGDRLPRHHIQRQHQGNRQQADRGGIHHLTAKHPQAQAEQHQTNQLDFLTRQLAHLVQRGIGPGRHFTAVGHARFVQVIGDQRRDNQQQQPNRQEGQEPLHPTDMHAGNLADELDPQHVGRGTGDEH